MDQVATVGICDCPPVAVAPDALFRRFLPGMLRGGEPVEYRCEYRGGRLVGVRVLPLEHPIGGR